MRRSLARGLEATAVFILTLPLLALLHEILILLFASLLNKITEIGLVARGFRLILKSPVHAQLVVETLGGIRPRGIAASGALGAWLQQAFPGLFVQPELAASGSWVSAILDRTSTVLSLFLTRASVEVVFIVLGALLLRAGLRGGTRRTWMKTARVHHMVLVALGLVMEAQAIWMLFVFMLSSPSRLYDMGIGFALSLIWQVEPTVYAWLMGSFFPVAIPSGLVGIGVIMAAFLSELFDRIRRWRGGKPGSPESGRWHVAHRGALLIAVLPFVGWVSQSESYYGIARTSLVGAPEIQSVVAPLAPILPPEPVASAEPKDGALSMHMITAPSSPGPTPTFESSPPPPSVIALVPTPTLDAYSHQTFTLAPTPEPTPTSTATATPTPEQSRDTQVSIRQTERGHLLTVNGQPVVVTGMNYNVNYTALPAETKRALHRRDFQIMKESGVNAVIGWGVYDEVTLEIAREFGIGVVMPFELDPQGAFENQGYRQEVKDKWRVFIARFKGFPAVWAWNPGGDELLHRMDTEQHRTVDKLQAAADFLVELSVLARRLDPNRVSVIKEPRDWYIPHLHEAVKKAQALSPGVQVGTFLVYGVNVYGNPDEMVDALRTAQQNAEQRLGIALLVGEFAPFGLARTDRGVHYARIWDDVLAFSPNGGFAYVFGPDQPNPQAPNPYDPLRLLVNEFSLVDIDGKPVDGALGALSAKYHQVQDSMPAP